MKQLLIVGLLLISTMSFGSIADVYIAQAAAGGANGVDCADAFAYTFFNTGANWGVGAAQIGAGSTVHLCGTVTTFNGSTYDTLVFLGSGSSGNPITLKWETGAKLSMPSCGTISCIQTNHKNFLVIDGGTNGILEATDNGTLLGHQDTGSGIHDGNNGCQGCEIKNLTFSNIYVHTSTADNAGAMGIILTGDGISIHNNKCHDASWCINVSPSVGSNPLGFQAYGNTCWNADHCIGFGNGSSVATVASIVVHDNEHYDAANWDTTGNTFHHDGIHLFGGGSGNLTVNDVEVYNNYFHGNWGASATSVGIFIQWMTNDPKINVYNNISILGAGTTQENTGAIFVCGNGTGCAGTTNIVVANNTIIGLGFGTGLSFGHPNAIAENNIVQNFLTLVNVDSTATYTTFDHNSYSQGDATLRFKFNINYYATLALWQASQSAEANSQYVTDNLLDSTGRPTAGSPAIQPFGANLTALGITALNSDRLGAARPAVAAWDAGALDFLAYSGFQGNGGISGNAGVK